MEHLLQGLSGVDAPAMHCAPGMTLYRGLHSLSE